MSFFRFLGCRLVTFNYSRQNYVGWFTLFQYVKAKKKTGSKNVELLL